MRLARSVDAHIADLAKPTRPAPEVDVCSKTTNWDLRGASGLKDLDGRGQSYVRTHSMKMSPRRKLPRVPIESMADSAPRHMSGDVLGT